MVLFKMCLQFKIFLNFQMWLMYIDKKQQILEILGYKIILKTKKFYLSSL